MTTHHDLDRIVDEYLHRLDEALTGVSPVRRRQLVEEIEEHLDEARSSLPEQTEAAVRTMLERVGDPEDIAAEEAASSAAPGPRRHRHRWAFAAIALVVLVGGVAAAVGLTTDTQPMSKAHRSVAVGSKFVTVPDVVGLSIAGAGKALTTLEFGLAISYSSSTILPRGIVVRETPAAGAKVAKGSAIHLVVSAGLPGSPERSP